jgi:hypothetical protein
MTDFEPFRILMIRKGIRMKRITTILLVTLFSGVFSMGCQAYEKAYAKTPSNKIEIKSIPSSKTLVTEKEGYYFNDANGLFMRLFNYIKNNDVAMTTPVEARMNNASMLFYVGSNDEMKSLEDQKEVQVVIAPERKVASLGMKGSYTEKNFKKAEKRLKEWLDGQTEYAAKGEAYGVFWNGPFMPGFLKHFEVHIPVEKKLEVNPLDKDKGLMDQSLASK